MSNVPETRVVKLSSDGFIVLTDRHAKASGIRQRPEGDTEVFGETSSIILSAQIPMGSRVQFVSKSQPLSDLRWDAASL